MKFRDIIQKHLLTEGRTKAIDEAQAVDIFKRDTAQRTDFYRGIYGFDANFGLVKPRGKNRKSQNTQNYYTLIMDNSDKWSKYPNRSDSIICSTDSFIVDNYGTPYHVYPFKGYTIGVCILDDIWESFNEVNTALGYSDASLDLMNNCVDEIVNKIRGVPLNDPNHSELKSRLSHIHLNDMREYDVKWTKITQSLVNFWESETNYDNLYDLYEGLLDPKLNGFSLRKTGELIGKRNREVWTNAPSLLVKSEINGDFLLNNRKSIGIKQ